MKTSHQFARELLAGPDLPIIHFDPSQAGMDDENDTSVSEPTAQAVHADGETVLESFLTICGEPGSEPYSDREIAMEKALRAIVSFNTPLPCGLLTEAINALNLCRKKLELN